MDITRSKIATLTFCTLTGLFLSAGAVDSANEPDRLTAGGAQFKCAPSPVEIVDRPYNGAWNFNAELAANAFAVQAAASYDAYEPRDHDSRAFRLADNHPDLRGDPVYGKTGWTLVGRHENGSGLLYDVYHHAAPDRLIVMVAYRGTDSWVGMDTIANASWVTQWLNPWDQYRQARNEFVAVVEDAAKAAKNRPIAFVTTGHSLGGGLAQHVAHVHPCISAVVFNSSFVTNTTFHGNYTPRVIRLYEKGDKFEELASTIVNSKDQAIYRLGLTKLDGIGFKHNMERFAVGSSRMAIDCTKTTPGCEVRDAALATTLYCERYYGFRWRQDPDFAKRTKDDGICTM